VMVWHKTTGMQPLALPKYNCEFVVYARKGTPRFVDTKGFRCCFEGKSREHSQKPDEFYDMIAKATEGPRISLFSRGGHEGFEAWGDEVDKFPPAKKAIEVNIEDLDV
jgi:N6-adenosine-specific RNA methylase IME4